MKSKHLDCNSLYGNTNSPVRLLFGVVCMLLLPVTTLWAGFSGGLLWPETGRTLSGQYALQAVQPGLSLEHASVMTSSKDREKLPATATGVPMGKGLRNGHGFFPLPGTGSPPAYLPDIEIVSVEIKTMNKYTPYRRKVVVRLHNIGGWYDGRNHPCTLTFSTRGPLGTDPDKEITINKTIPAEEREYSCILGMHIHGPHSVLVTAHLADQRELRLDNNTMSKRFSLKALPDLAIFLSQPGDVRVGKKRWFRLRVKNIGTAMSKPARLKLHINRDGDHFYAIPSLQPGETYPRSGKKSIQRGIKWWKKGKKKYYAQITYDHPEIRQDNNRVEGYLQVYLPTAARFDPKAHVQYCTRIALKQHGRFMTGRKEKLTFVLWNRFPQSLTAQTRFSLQIVREGAKTDPLSPPNPLDEFEVGPFFPKEIRYKTITYTFSLPGRYKIMVSSKNKKYRNWGSCSNKPEEIGSFNVTVRPVEMPHPPQR